MTRANLFRLGVIVVAACLAIALLVWKFSGGRPGADDAAGRPRPAAEQKADADAGLVTVDREAQARSGIEVSAVAGAEAQTQTQAYATIGDPTRLIDLETEEASARSQLDAATAKASASRQAFERTRLLYKDDQNASLAQLQAAEAAFRADEAATTAARAQALRARATAEQELGPVLAAGRHGLLQALMQRRSLLVQITVSPGERQGTAPASAVLLAPDGGRVAARLLGPAPRVDPKLQAMSSYYLAPAGRGLLPGMNIMALLSTGTSRPGAAVPASALVSWQGQSWIYQRVGPERFQRLAIPTDTPTPQGGYVTGALKPGALVVTRGAQLLLSQEFKPTAQAAPDVD